MKFKIGNIEIKNQVVLAPMAGISNPAFMCIAEKMNAGLVYTELISAEAVIRNNKKTLDMLKGIEDINIPVAVQIFGSNAEVLSNAAKILTKLYPIKIIDINMGCPVPKVTTRAGSGSALLKDINKIYDIVSSVVKSTNANVTVKIRSGWNKDTINAVEVAKTVEKAGAVAIAIHPRTREQGYSGVADWKIIKDVKNNVNIPVIGNGDIKSIYDAKKMIDETGCDAVMIGRACLGNPFLLREVAAYLEDGTILDKANYIEKIDTAIKHFKLLLKYNDKRKAVLEMRGHISHYLKGLNNVSEVRNKLTKVNSSEELIHILEDFKNNYTVVKNK